MLTGFLSLPFFIANALTLESIRGVSPENIVKYQPDADGNWHCLTDPSIVIPFERVNDNYCDCPDGSDEPGTSACSNGSFFCKNDGFESHFIPSFKVDDGVCDYDVCCDGSDESFRVCENRCVSMKIEHDKQVREHNQKINQGLVIKKKLAQKSKTMRAELEKALAKYQQYISATEEKLVDLESMRGKVDENEEIINDNFKVIETDLDTLSDTLFQSFDQLKIYVSKLELLENILETMTRKYNHNFNDPAVKEAAQEYLNFAASFDTSEEESDDDSRAQRVAMDQITTFFKESFKNFKTDIEKVRGEIVTLQQNQSKIETSDKLTLKSPSIFAESWDVFVIGLKRLVDSFLGVESRIVTYEESVETYKDVTKPDISNREIEEQIAALNTRLEHLKSEVSKSESELNKNYGPDDILRALPDCIVSKIGSYKYKLCPTSVLEQINSDGRGTKIGVFENLTFSEETQNFQFSFKRGERCWNGPVREAVVDIVCGTKEELLIVTEPEKCMYRLKMVSPLGCFESDLL